MEDPEKQLEEADMEEKQLEEADMEDPEKQLEEADMEVVSLVSLFFGYFKELRLLQFYEIAVFKFQ